MRIEPSSQKTTQKRLNWFVFETENTRDTRQPTTKTPMREKKEWDSTPNSAKDLLKGPKSCSYH
jgi:hypothetical protein